jgi:tyrosine-protein kinase
VSLSQLEPSAAQPSQLQEYLGVLRTYKWSILAVTLAAVAAALLYSLRQTPIYSSSTDVLVKPSITTTEATGPNPFFNIDTEAQVANSTLVAEQAADILGYDGHPTDLLAGLSVAPAAEAQILTFTYSSTDPEEAAERAGAFASGYLEYRRQQSLQSQEDAITAIRERLVEYRSRLTAKNEAIQATTDTALLADLTSARDSLKALIQTLKLQLADIPLNIELDPGNILVPPSVPTSPTSPKPVRTVALAALVGLALGGALALLRERLDDRLSGRDDLESHAGAAVLSVIPRMTEWRKRENAYLVTESQPHSVAAEAYRTLRTGVLFAASQWEVKTLMVTSSHQEEGKTATSANLGVVLAQAGKRVILVSADLRKPRLQAFFGVQPKKGLTSVLAGEAKALDVLQPVAPAMHNLRLLPSGPIPGNPAELLGSEAMDRLLSDLRDAADFVIVDVAPVLAVSDAMTLSPLCDAVLFVADAINTSRGSVERAREQLDQVNARLIGTVLNNFDPSKARAYSAHSYGYYAYRHDSRDNSRKLSNLPWANRKG